MGNTSVRKKERGLPVVRPSFYHVTPVVPEALVCVTAGINGYLAANSDVAERRLFYQSA